MRRREFLLSAAAGFAVALTAEALAAPLDADPIKVWRVIEWRTGADGRSFPAGGVIACRASELPKGDRAMFRVQGIAAESPLQEPDPVYGSTTITMSAAESEAHRRRWQHSENLIGADIRALIERQLNGEIL